MQCDSYAHPVIAAIGAKYLILEPFFLFMNEQVTTAISIAVGLSFFVIFRND